LPISDRYPDRSARGAARRGARGRSAGYKLQALRDFTFGMSQARDFDESLRLALMVIMGTFSIAKGVLFLEEEGEFRTRVSRGLAAGIPPMERSAELLSCLRRLRRPFPVRGRATARAVREAVAAVERTVPALSAEFCCPLGTRKGVLGILLLGPTLTGRALTLRQRETLGVMVSFLSANISNHNVVLEISSLNDLLRHQVRENGRLLGAMQAIYLDTIRALAAAIDAKDPYTRGHSERVARISVSIARALRLPEREVQAVEVASLLHDVGKIATDRTVLTKVSALTRSETRELQRHPRTSYDILSEIRFPYPDVAILARHHHERLDGSGYPDGKRDREIPFGARIIAVADAFDAMVSDRPYRASLPLVHALREIRADVDRQFDPTVALAFFRLVRSELNGDGGALGLVRKNGSAAVRREAIAFLDRSIRDLP
jgi:putative nucleotidyltransferase with HDIG domain